MSKANVAFLAGLLAVAAMLGTAAATRTVSLGAASHRASDATIRARTRQLDAYAASLQRALARKLPALPAAPAGGAVSPATSSQAPVVVYRRPPPVIVVKHTHHGDDGGGELEAQGGGGDD